MNIADLPPIAPEEAALAVIGVRAVISRTVERITKAQLHEMDDLPKEIGKLAKSLCRDGMVETPTERVNYRPMLKQLSEGIKPQQLEEMVAAFPPGFHDLAGAFLSFSLQLVQQLQQMLPKSVFQTLAGYTNLVPSDVAVWRFANILGVLDNPLSVFSLMGTGALLKSQVGALRLVYPTLTKCIDEAIDEAKLDEQGVKQSWRFAPRAEIGVRVWTGTPRIDPKTLTALQANTQAAKDQQAAQKQQIADRTSQASKDTLTGTQRALYPAAT
jgi:hypothetical protein